MNDVIEVETPVEPEVPAEEPVEEPAPEEAPVEEEAPEAIVTYYTCPSCDLQVMTTNDVPAKTILCTFCNENFLASHEAPDIPS